MMSNPIILANTITLLAFIEFLQSREEEIPKQLTKPILLGLSELRQQILSRLQGVSGIGAVIAIIETQGILAPDQLQCLVPLLADAMKADSAFADRISYLANAISQEPGISSLLGKNIQSVAGGTATQINEPNAPTFTGSFSDSTFNFYYGNNLSPQTNFRRSNNSAVPTRRLELFSALARLPSPQFEEILFALNPPPGNMPSAHAPQGNRVKSLLDWAETIGPGLDMVEEICIRVITQKTSNLLPQALIEHSLETDLSKLEPTDIQKNKQAHISNTTFGDRNKSQPISPDFAVYKQEEWVGREEETDGLLKAIKGSCRITVVLGITGIGKTALAERIIDELRSGQGNLLRHNFEYDPTSSNKSFVEVAKEWLRKLGENIPIQEHNLENIRSLLADKLCHSPYIILMDSLEYILTGNEDLGWGDFLDEGWNKFFLKILSAESCQSSFILTSQDLPLQLKQVGGHYPNFFSYQILKGLEEKQQVELFKKQGLDCGEEEQWLLCRIGKAYMGHPLALRVIAKEIKIDFHADITEYWEKFGFEIEEVEKSLKEATKGNTLGQDNWKLDSYSRELRILVRKRLETTFERLKNNACVAFELICKVSVYRRPERETAWLIQLEDDYDKKERRQALDILKDRALVEITYDPVRKINLLGLHNLIRSQALYYRRQ